MKNVVSGLAFCGAILALSLPAIAFTTPGPAGAMVDYSVQFQPINSLSYPSSAYLNLRISRDNIVTGFYSTPDNPMPVPVTGGRDGQRIWMNVGSGRLHIEARFKDDQIVGTAFEHNREFDMTAVPQPHSGS